MKWNGIGESEEGENGKVEIVQASHFDFQMAFVLIGMKTENE